jgi:hypothetical protein
LNRKFRAESDAGLTPVKVMELPAKLDDRAGDKVREETLVRQKAQGVVPQDTQLTQRSEGIPAWDSLDADHKRVAAHMMEVYAAALSYCDSQMGRVVDAIADTGKLDNTLIIYIQGDNGASAEGGPQGLLNEMSFFNAIPEDFSEVMRRMDELGGPTTFNHYPIGWAHAMDTPFQWTKQIASHFGGTPNGMVISWPDRIKDKGGVRTRFHHATNYAFRIILGQRHIYAINATCSRPPELGLIPCMTMRNGKSGISRPRLRRAQPFFSGQRRDSRCSKFMYLKPVFLRLSLNDIGSGAASPHPAVTAFPDNVVGSACTSSFSRICSAFTRVAARTLAPSPICDLLHRRLQPFRHLHDCSGCFRLERLPGGACTHWRAPPCHGAHVKRSFLVAAPGRRSWGGKRPTGARFYSWATACTLGSREMTLSRPLPDVRSDGGLLLEVNGILVDSTRPGILT